MTNSKLKETLKVTDIIKENAFEKNESVNSKLQAQELTEANQISVEQTNTAPRKNSTVEKTGASNSISAFVKNEHREKLAKKLSKESVKSPKFILAQLLSGFVAGNLNAAQSAMINDHYAKIPAVELDKLHNILSSIPTPEELNRRNNKEKNEKEQEEKAAMIAYLPKFILDLFRDNKLPFYLIATCHLLPDELLKQYYDELCDDHEEQHSKSDGHANDRTKDNYPDIRGALSAITYAKVKAVCDEINSKNRNYKLVESKNEKDGGVKVAFVDRENNEKLLNLNVPLQGGKVDVILENALYKKAPAEISQAGVDTADIAISNAKNKKVEINTGNFDERANAYYDAMVDRFNDLNDQLQLLLKKGKSLTEEEKKQRNELTNKVDNFKWNSEPTKEEVAVANYQSPSPFQSLNKIPTLNIK